RLLSPFCKLLRRYAFAYKAERFLENLREGWEPWPARPVRSFSGAPQRQRSGGQPGPQGRAQHKKPFNTLFC
ncbi:MAG: hypothetical protein NZ529_11410, partial [Cytophagaceae bacterium]|nr:hypothetical protein [Cytophagaceae bacterium]MDW8457391.1 hypothetical protein [Cytophagaceae bacterium]